MQGRHLQWCHNAKGATMQGQHLQRAPQCKGSICKGRHNAKGGICKSKPALSRQLVTTGIMCQDKVHGCVKMRSMGVTQ